MNYIPAMGFTLACSPRNASVKVTFLTRVDPAFSPDGIETLSEGAVQSIRRNTQHRNHSRCQHRASRYALLFLTLSFLSQAINGQEEFSGPLASWTSVRQYGAQGDGIADDTVAVQSALSNLGVSGRSPVLYLPKGTYNISTQLILAQRLGITIVGEDPASVKIKWVGPAGGVLLWLNGVCYSRFSRLTFDGGGTASVLVDQSWDGQQGCFDTDNEYSDDIFSGAPTGIGIRGGNLGYGFAETSVRRTQFLSLNKGITLQNFNALDLWIWDSLFDHCSVGVTNDPGAGNWHVYNSVFRYSTTADNLIGNTGGFSFIGNYSVGAGSFIGAAGLSAPALTLVQANTINSTATPAWGSPIINGNQGPLILLDNKIGSSSPGSGTAVNAWSWSGDADVVSVGNSFVTATPESVQGRLLSVDDLTSQTIAFSEPVLPATPPNLNRTVFEVPVGATSNTVQGIINNAVKTSRSVVHFPFGDYYVFVTVPSSDIQIIGDGMFATRVFGTIQLQGPASHVLVRDVGIYGSGAGDGVVLSEADQIGGRLFLEGLNTGSSTNNILYDGLNNLTIEARDLSHAAAKDTSIALLGSGTINVFSAASNGNPLAYSVSGGNMLVRDEWYDSGGGAFLSASGASTVTVAGSHVAGSAASTITFGNFGGISAILASDLTTTSDTLISGTSTGQVFGAGMVGTALDYFVNQTSAPTALVNSKTTSNPPPGYGSSTIPNQGVYDPTLLRTTLSQTRGALPGPINDLSPAVTDVRLYRVGIGGFNVGLHLLPSASPTPSSGPVLGVSKSHSGNFTQGQTNATYTVTVSNASGAGPTSGAVNVTEALPSGLTLVSMAGTGWSCSSNVCSRSDVLNAGSSYPVITVTVNVAANASSPQVNQVSVSGGTSASVSAAAVSVSATDSTTIVPMPAVLSISKHHKGNFKHGQVNATYTVTVSNASGAGPTSGTVNVTEALPSGLSLVSMVGTGWSCSSNVCSRSDALNPGSSYPVITVTVNVAANPTSPQVNQVSVSGGGSAAASATDSTVVH